jgi:hypothetical protein
VIPCHAVAINKETMSKKYGKMKTIYGCFKMRDYKFFMRGQAYRHNTMCMEKWNI